MEIFSFCYNSISEGMSRRLNDLISSVWGNVEGKPLHLRELNAMSFCAADGAILLPRIFFGRDGCETLKAILESIAKTVDLEE